MSIVCCYCWFVVIVMAHQKNVSNCHGTSKNVRNFNNICIIQTPKTKTMTKKISFNPNVAVYTYQLMPFERKEKRDHVIHIMRKLQMKKKMSRDEYIQNAGKFMERKRKIKLINNANMNVSSK